MKLTAKAYAKLNLTLDVSKKRADGYHNIESIFQSISLFDILEIERTKSGISVCTDSSINETDNICFKAAKLFFDATKLNGGATIRLTKNIPIAAGLGGGSTDGAATLEVLNRLYDKPLSNEEILGLCKKLGADVPFCLFGGTAYASGIGDKLRKTQNLADCDIIIIKNATKPSTAELYRRLDECEISKRPDTAAVLCAIENGDLYKACENFYNVFSLVWGNNLNEVEEDLQKEGAITAKLSGSGPSVFGIYEKGKGENAYNNLCKKYKDIYLCAPNCNSGVEIVE